MIMADNRLKPFEGDFVLQRGNPGSFVNNNMEGLSAYKEIRRKRIIESSNIEINNLKNDVTALKNDITQIKELLLKAIENK